ncbi:MAG TPA: YciI family protein [Xanthobacteraceae bacterium]|nr:YciI family protein [Xanthobacteraceae bacterium]
MLYAVLFTDDAAHADARRRLMPAHLDFLERHRDRIRAAGPLREAADGTPAGGLWLVEAESADAVTDLYRSDPLWPTGLRRAVRVLQWSQVFADGRRLI